MWCSSLSFAHVCSEPVLVNNDHFKHRKWGTHPTNTCSHRCRCEPSPRQRGLSAHQPARPRLSAQARAGPLPVCINGVLFLSFPYASVPSLSWQHDQFCIVLESEYPLKHRVFVPRPTLVLGGLGARRLGSPWLLSARTVQCSGDRRLCAQRRL
jgi:hypothetical protein